jgi:copper chaperone NosL
MKRILLYIAALLLFSVSTVVWGAAIKPVKPAPKDKCPVCGMFVAKYPDFAGQVHFKDNSVYHFDGSKDLFRFYLNSTRYTAGKKTAEVTAVYVTSYYDLSLIDGTSAWFVAGSNVYGPMGRELIPFAKESEAREFKKDHSGKTILRFKDVTAAVLKGLD